jgi:hypothetical protein
MNKDDRIKAVVAALEAAGFPFEATLDSPWVPPIEERLGQRFPVAFRSLLTQYTFPEFEVGGVTVFSNLNDGSTSDITVAPFSDPALSRWLIDHKLIQFGRPGTGSYDPVCFDTSDKKEPGVVVVDHEDILLERKKVRVRRLAESFLELVDVALHNKPLKNDARKNARAS